jgi:flagellin-specific chaperone FliS
MNFNRKGLFQLNDKNTTLEGLIHVKDALDCVLQNVKSIHDNKDNKEFDKKKICKETITKLAFLVKTLDPRKKESNLSKDLDYLYKHCIFCVVRVRDFNDYEFIKGCTDVLSEISEGWERVTAAVANYPS